MPDFLAGLRYDALTPLLTGSDSAVAYFTRRDLLEQPVESLESIWTLPAVQRILKRQQSDGSWLFPGRGHDNRLVETFKQLRFLVDQYAMDRSQPAVEQACEFILAFQTDQGDIRGIMQNQMTAYYTGAILALLIKSGYQSDRRILKALDWLLQVRQDDGGWVELPGMLGLKISAAEWNLMVRDRGIPTARAYAFSRPFSINATGMVLRAFCLHPRFQDKPEIHRAAALLKGAFFKPNNYSTYAHPDNWLRFQFPFWWNNLLSAMDSLSRLKPARLDDKLYPALAWFADHQEADGLWRISYSGIHKSSPNSRSAAQQLWISLAVCRMLKAFSRWQD